MKQKKPTAKQRQLQQEWQAMLDKHNSWPKFSKTSTPPKAKPVEAVQPVKSIPAKYVPHGGTAKPVMQYTGDKILGITVMHKSCLQPVFDAEAAVDAAHMRR
jgi:hypothetical protein